MEEMYYNKINTLFKRDENNGNVIIPKSFSCLEFQYLKNCYWECTEKIDGMNIMILYKIINGISSLEFRGKTKKSFIPLKLHEWLKKNISIDDLDNTFSDKLQKKETITVQLFGEGIGTGINCKTNRYSKDNNYNLVIFDILINYVWLTKTDIEEIALKLHLPTVPLIGYYTLHDATQIVCDGFTSIYNNRDEIVLSEGLVLKPMLYLKDRLGRRIITKLKTVDFKKYLNKNNNEYPENWIGYDK